MVSRCNGVIVSWCHGVRPPYLHGRAPSLVSGDVVPKPPHGFQDPLCHPQLVAEVHREELVVETRGIHCLLDALAEVEGPEDDLDDGRNDLGEDLGEDDLGEDDLGGGSDDLGAATGPGHHDDPALGVGDDGGAHAAHRPEPGGDQVVEEGRNAVRRGHTRRGEVIHLNR